MSKFFNSELLIFGYRYSKYHQRAKLTFSLVTKNLKIKIIKFKAIIY